MFYSATFAKVSPNFFKMINRTSFNPVKSLAPSMKFGVFNIYICRYIVLIFILDPSNENSLFTTLKKKKTFKNLE